MKIKSRLIIFISILMFCISAGCDADMDGIFIAVKSYNYGKVNIGDTKYFELEIENFSEETRKIEEIIIFNTPRNEFWIEGPNTYISVPGKGKKYLNVWFEPIIEGDKSIFVQIIAQSGKIFNLKLYGVAIGEADIEIPASSMDFGVGYINHNKSQILRILNIGTGISALNSVNFTGISALDFSVSNSSFPIDLYPQFSYPENYSVELTINYNPNFKGNSTATLILDIGEDNKEYAIPLLGIAKDPAPEIEISHSKYDFGSVDVGNSASKEFTIRNTGVEALGISQIVIASISSSDFVITEAKLNTGRVLKKPYYSNIEPGESLLFTVEFKPTIQGYKHSANVEISHDLSLDPSKIELSGNSDQSIVINECQTSDRPTGYGDWIEIRNTGSSNVDISGWKIECWQGTRLEVTYTFPNGSNLGGYQHFVADDYSLVGNTLPHFYIGANLLWNGGGIYPGNYEVILKDSNDNGIDYICFGNPNSALAQHIPSNILWNQSDYINLTPGMQYIYRTSDQNDFSSNGWACGSGSGTPLSANPGQ